MAWTTPTFNAADFTAYSGSWTVAQGNLHTNAYKWLNADTMVWSFDIYGTSNSSSTVGFKIKIPEGKTPAKAMCAFAMVYDNGVGTPGVCTVCVPVPPWWPGDVMSIYRLDGGLFSPSSGGLHMVGQIIFEVA